MMKTKKATTVGDETQSQKQSKLGLCMRSLICCKRTNKITQKTAEQKKSFVSRICPCLGSKKDTGIKSSKAWSSNAETLAPSPAKKKYENKNYQNFYQENTQKSVFFFLNFIFLEIFVADFA